MYLGSLDERETRGGRVDCGRDRGVEESGRRIYSWKVVRKRESIGYLCTSRPCTRRFAH